MDIEPASTPATPVGPTTPRAQAKAERRRAILAAAALLMARRGFHSVRLDDIGAAVGVSGPAMYRHFPSKEAVLEEMLLDISLRLRDGGLAAVDRGGTPETVLRALLAVHIDFVVAEPDLITVQFRDLGTLPDSSRHQVRALQRQYAEMWVSALLGFRPEVDELRARTHVHAVFGLLNSSPMLPKLAEPELRTQLADMALAALRA